MAPAEVERGCRMLNQRLDELRTLYPDMIVTLSMAPYVPLALVVIDGEEVLIDMLNLIRRTDDRKQPRHDHG